jgi:hypothetical protein
MCQARRGHADLGAGFRHVCRTSPGARSLREKRAAFSPKGCHQLPTTRRAKHAHARCEQATRISVAASADITDTGIPASLLLSCCPPVPLHVPRHARVSAVLSTDTAPRFVASARHEWLRDCTIRPLPAIHLLDPFTRPQWTTGIVGGVPNEMHLTTHGSIPVLSQRWEVLSRCAQLVAAGTRQGEKNGDAWKRIAALCHKQCGCRSRPSPEATSLLLSSVPFVSSVRSE